MKPGRSRPRFHPFFLVAACVVSLLCSARPASGHTDIEVQIDDLTRRIQSEPGDATLFLRRGELHRIHRDWSAAQADYRAARRLDPGLLVVDLCLGRMFLDQDRPGRAKDALDRYLSKRPEDAEGLTLRGAALGKMGRLQEGIADYRRALALPALRTSAPDTYLELVKLLTAAGDEHREEALRTLDEGIAALGPIVSLELPAIELALSLRRFDDALKRVDILASQSGRRERWLLRRAEILRQAGRTQEAAGAYQDVLKLIASLPEKRRAAPDTKEFVAQACKALASVADSKNGPGVGCP
jgi:predicted Zn-dependent protease